MPCFAGGQCGDSGLSWELFTAANFVATVDSGTGVITDNPGSSLWDISGASSLVIRLSPVSAFAIDQLVRVGNCQALTIDVRSPSNVSLFSGTPETCGSGVSTPINSAVGHVLISGLDDGATTLYYGYFNYTGSLSAAFWQNFHGQHELA